MDIEKSKRLVRRADRVRFCRPDTAVRLYGEAAEADPDNMRAQVFHAAMSLSEAMNSGHGAAADNARRMLDRIDFERLPEDLKQKYRIIRLNDALFSENAAEAESLFAAAAKRGAGDESDRVNLIRAKAMLAGEDRDKLADALKYAGAMLNTPVRTKVLKNELDKTLAVLYLNTGNSGAALTKLTALLKRRQPKQVMLLLLMQAGMAEVMHRGPSLAALAYFERAKRIAPAIFIPAYQKCAIMYYNLGKYELGLKNAAVTLDIEADYTMLGVRGSCLIGLERYEEARKSLDHAVRLNPGEDGAYFERARLALIMKDNAAYLRDFCAFFENNGEPDRVLLLAGAGVQEGVFDEAGAAETILTIPARFADRDYVAGKLYGYGREGEKALRHLKAAYEAEPASYAVPYADALRGFVQEPDTKAVLDIYIERNCYYQLAQVYLYGDLGQPRDAERAGYYLRELLNIRGDSDVFSLAGRYHEIRPAGDLNFALKFYKKAYGTMGSGYDYAKVYYAHALITGAGGVQNRSLAKKIVLKEAENRFLYPAGNVALLYAYFWLAREGEFDKTAALKLLVMADREYVRCPQVKFMLYKIHKADGNETDAEKFFAEFIESLNYCDKYSKEAMEKFRRDPNAAFYPPLIMFQ